MPELSEQIRELQRANRIAKQLREQQREAMEADVNARPTYFETRGAAGQAPIVSIDYGAILDKGINAYKRTSTEAELRDAEAKREAMTSDVLQGALSNPEGVDTASMVGLYEAGIDPRVIKMMAPKGDDALGKNQMLQYGQTSAGMRVVNQLQPGTFSEEFIAQAEQRERAELDARRAPRGGSGGGSDGYAKPPKIGDHAKILQDKLAIAIMQGDPEAIKQAQENVRMYMESTQKPGAGGRASGGGRGGKGNVDPAAQLSELKKNTAELRSLITSPSARAGLFSTKQRVTVPALLAAGGGDTPSVLGTAVAQAARGDESPEAARLRRLAAAQSFDVVKQLYPASNTDIKLALSLQPQIGESEESMLEYLRVVENIVNKAERGDYGPPSGGGGATDEAAVPDPDDELLLRYLPRK